LDAKFKITNKLSLYGQLMADDLSNKDTLDNHYGWQSGLLYFDALGIKNFFLQVEFNSVTKNSYNNPSGSSTDQSYSHYNQTLAYTPLYGNELILIADYKRKRFFFNGKFIRQLKNHNLYSN